MNNIFEFKQLLNKSIQMIKDYKVSHLLYIACALSIFIALSNIMFSILLQKIMYYALNQNFSSFLMSSLFFMLISILYGFIFYSYNQTKEKLSQEILKITRMNILKNALFSDSDVKNSFDTSTIQTLFLEDAQNIAYYLVETFFPILQIIASIVIGSLYIGYYSKIILICTLVVAAIFFYLNNILSKKNMASFANIQKSNGFEKQLLKTLFNIIDISKIYNIHAFFLSKYQEMAKDRENYYSAHAKNEGMAKSLGEAIILGTELVILIIGVVQVANQQLTFPNLVGVWNAAIGTLIYPFFNFPNIVNKFAEQKISSQRISHYLNTIETSSDIKEDYLVQSENPKLILKDIQFKREEKLVLDKFNLELEIGKLVMIKGESGGGKTTLLKIILQFLKPSSGEIYISEKGQIKNKIYPYFAYVPQGEFLLDIPIKDNLLMANIPYPNAQMANLFTRLGLPKDILLKNTHSLSLGEQQRLAIIRALLSHAPYIVMDEPFASLDDNTIEVLVDIINHTKLKKGFIIITHREAPGLKADQVINLKKRG